MHFPIQSSQEIRRSATQGQAPYLEAHLSVTGPSQLITPFNCFVNLGRYRREDGTSEWMIVLKPQSPFPFNGIANWFPPKPSFLTVAIQGLDRRDVESIIQNLLGLYIESFPTEQNVSLSVLEVEEGTSNSLRTIPLNNTEELQNASSFILRQVSEPINHIFIPVSSNSSIFRFGSTAVKVGLACGNGQTRNRSLPDEALTFTFDPNNLFWINADVFFTRIGQYHGFEIPRGSTNSLPRHYRRRQGSDRISLTYPLQIRKSGNRGGLGEIRAAFLGLQLIDLDFPISSSSTSVPETVFYVMRNVGDTNLGRFFFTPPDILSQLISVSWSVDGTSMDSITPSAIIEIPWENLLPENTAGSRDLSITFAFRGLGNITLNIKIVDSAIHKAHSKATMIIQNQAEHLEWLNSNEGLTSNNRRDVIPLYHLIDNLLSSSSHLNASRRNSLSNQIDRTSNSLFHEISERLNSFNSQMERLISSPPSSSARADTSLERIVFNEPYFKNELLTRPTPENWAKFAVILRVLSGTSKGRTVLIRYYQNALDENARYGSGHTVTVAETVSIANRMSSLTPSTWKAFSGGILEPYIQHHAGPIASAIRRARPNVNLLDIPEVRRLLNRIRANTQRFGVGFNYRSVQNSNSGLYALEISNISLPERIDASSETGRLITQSLPRIVEGINLAFSYGQVLSSENTRAQAYADLTVSTASFFAQFLEDRSVRNIIEMNSQNSTLRRPLERLVRHARLINRSLSVVSAGISFWGYLNSIEEFRDIGDRDAEAWASVALFGSMITATGSVITLTVVGSPVGAGLMAIGGFLELVAAVGIIATESSELGIILQYSVFGINYRNIPNPSPYRSFHGNVEAQISRLFSELYPITGNLTYNLSRQELHLNLEATMFCRKSRLRIELLQVNANFDFQFDLDEQFRHRGGSDNRAYALLINSTTGNLVSGDVPISGAFDFTAPTPSNPKLGIRLTIPQNVNLSFATTTTVRVYLSSGEVSHSNPFSNGHRNTNRRTQETYIDTATFKERYPYCTKAVFNRS